MKAFTFPGFFLNTKPLIMFFQRKSKWIDINGFYSKMALELLKLKSAKHTTRFGLHVVRNTCLHNYQKMIMFFKKMSDFNFNELMN